MIGPLQGWDDSAALYPDQGGMQEVCWKLVLHLLAQVVFARLRKCRNIYDFGKFAHWV
jgi:hypothetical protein